MTVLHLHDPAKARLDRPGSVFDRREFRCWVGCTRVMCNAIERDRDGRLWVLTTNGERHPSEAVTEIVKGERAQPAVSPTGEALDAFLAGFPGVAK